MKKVISLVLVVALVLGSFGMAFAADETTAPQTTATATKGLTDINDSANLNAIKVVNDLGIVTGYPDKTFKPTQNVTRAEFAAMICRALGVPDSALAGFTTSKFKDTEGYGWAVKYLGYCAAKGIMEGYGDGTVRPGNNITVNEALTMVCRALGYVNEAKELVGTWPSNYIALSQQLKLFRDMSAEGIINRENAAQVIYNALTVKNVYIDADGVTQNQKGETIYNGQTQKYEDQGVTWLGLNGGEPAASGNEFVLTPEMADKAVINVRASVGALVKGFINEDGEIIAIDVLSEFLDGKYKEADGVFKAGDVEYFISKGLVEKPEKLEDKTVITVNGQVANAKTTLKASPSAIIAVKLKGKTISEVYSLNYWEQSDIFQYTDGDIDKKACTFDGSSTWKFKKDNNGEIDMNYFALVGVDTLDDIKKDNVIQIYENKYGQIAKVAVGTKVVEGTIEKVSKDNDEFTIAGTAYGYAGEAAKAPKLGDEGTAYLTQNGKIGVWKVSDATKGNYAVVLGVDESSSFGKTTAKIKLLTKDGTVIEKNVTSAVAKDATDLLTKVTTEGVIAFALNKAGDVNSIKGDKELSTVKGVYNNTSKTFSGTVVKADAVVFIKALDKQGNPDWSVATVDKLAEKTEITVDDYAKEDNQYAAFVVGTSAVGATDSYAVFNAVSKKVDADGDAFWYVEGFKDGEALAAYTSVNYVSDADTDAPFKSMPGKQALYKVSVDGEGLVKSFPDAKADGTKVKNIDEDEVVSVDTEYNRVELSSNGTVGLAKDVVIYVWSADKKAFTLETKLGQIKKKNVQLWMTDAKEGIYDIVIAW